MSTEPDSMVVRAPAKINLYLEVLGRRKDGYHDIRSIVVPVSLFDEVTLEKTPHVIETVVTDRGVVNGADLCLAKSCDNLTTKAAMALREATGYSGGACIRIEKNIPVGGGLGGGSADAAAVLNGLNRLWRTGLTPSELIQVGSRVGSDVPALVHGGAVLVEGIGETVSAVPGAGKTSGWWVALFNPGFSVSTRDIYSRCKTALTSEEKSIKSVVSALRDGDVDLAGRNLFNGLQATVFRKYPLIAILAEELEKAGAIGVLLCGSGASVFGLARNERHARRMMESVKKALGFPAWSRVTRILPDGVMAAHGPLEA